jgi:hypothetical protein
MMSSELPTSLRNIPSEISQLALAMSRRNGLSVADVLRLALVSGMYVEVSKAGPDRAGLYAGLDVDYLARSLRRLLATPIDLLLETGQHPYQGSFAIGAATVPSAPALVANAQHDSMMFDDALTDELEGLGMGMGLSVGLEDALT